MSKAKNSAPPKARTCALILGMHRSGTSALAGVLSKLGCAVPANQMPASKNNAKGFFESTVVRDLNEALLASAGSSWDDFTPFHEDWLHSPRAADFLDRAVAVLEGEFGAAQLFVLKDPRICRLVPFWIEALQRFGSTVRPILIIRNPLEVGHSLLTKRNFTEPLSQMIWLRHALDAEQATRGMPRFHTSFEELMDGWEIVAQKAQESLQLIWPKQMASVEFDVAKFLTGDLQHHKDSPTRALTSALLPEWLRETYDILNGWAQSGETVEDQARLDRIKTQFDVASSAFARAVRAEREASLETRLKAQELEDANKGLQAEADELRSAYERSIEEQRSAFETERAALQSQVAALAMESEEQRAALGARLARIEEEFAALQAEHTAAIADADQEIAELKKSLQEQRRATTLLNGELHQLRETKEAVEAELHTSQARRKESARVIARRDAELEQRYRELAALERHVLHSSFSWRARQIIRRLTLLLQSPSRAASESTQSPAVGA